jgi:SAM-dependent methyltransferase
MARHVCPWWLGYFLVNPLRRLWQHPARLLGPYLAEGMTVLEPGCGMGYFTLDVARIVGRRGRVVAVDVQPRMLAGLRRRAGRAGLLDHIELRDAGGAGLGVADLAGRVDLALVLHVLHEGDGTRSFLGEIHDARRPGGRLLLVEPRGHVSETEFTESVSVAHEVGFVDVGRPRFGRDLAALLARPDGGSDAIKG